MISTSTSSIEMFLPLLLLCVASVLAAPSDKVNTACGGGLYCPGTQTCCRIPSGMGCCPFTSGICCLNGTCCPYGTVCSGTRCLTASSDNSTLALKTTEAMKMPVTIKP